MAAVTKREQTELFYSYTINLEKLSEANSMVPLIKNLLRNQEIFTLYSSSSRKSGGILKETIRIIKKGPLSSNLTIRMKTYLNPKEFRITSKCLNPGKTKQMQTLYLYTINLETSESSVLKVKTLLESCAIAALHSNWWQRSGGIFKEQIDVLKNGPLSGDLMKCMKIALNPKTLKIFSYVYQNPIFVAVEHCGLPKTAYVKIPISPFIAEEEGSTYPTEENEQYLSKHNINRDKLHTLAVTDYKVAKVNDEEVDPPVYSFGFIPLKHLMDKLSTLPPATQPNQ